MSSKNENFVCIVLAAGKGTRMHSNLPKVLHFVCGRPMLDYALDTLRSLKDIKMKIVVVGYRHDLVKEYLKGEKDIKPVTQKRLLGTADAVKICKGFIPKNINNILVLYADNPLLTKSTLSRLLDLHIKSHAGATLLTARLKDPTGYGRIIRDNLSNVVRISEEGDLSYSEKDIDEINVGATCFNRRLLFDNMRNIKADNKKKEYYLTDIIQIMSAAGIKVESLDIEDPLQAQGVNSIEDLQSVSSFMRKRIIKENINKGVNIIDPQTTFIDSRSHIGENSIIYPFTIIESNVKIGSNCKIGPFCHLRPGTIIDDDAAIGNFIEVVRSHINKGTRAKHFGYLGDSFIGKFVNIGAGTVTANFDGEKKNITKIKDNSFVGSDTVFIAPVTIGKGATTGAGSVITRNTTVSDRSIVVGVPARPLKKVKPQHKK